MDAQVRKGEKSTHVVVWKFFDQEIAQAEGETTRSAGKIPMAKQCWIFKADQVDVYKKAEAAPISKSERFGAG